MRGPLYRSVALIAALSLVVPPPSFSQPAPAPAGDTATVFNAEQLDAMLAPIALYPDALLAQALMATTYPLEVVAASRWLDDPANKNLSGDALAQALGSQTWDPSVKSLVPFPQVLGMLNGKLDWTQQLGYAFATQQADVMDSVQRLRQQAQVAGYLKTTEQQTVVVEKTTIVIQPANPQTVYVPVYNPTVVYGAWPYPAYPPVYYPPPPGYVVGNAFVAGLAFATGVAVVGSLWGWAQPVWHGGHGGYGSVNVNVNHYNSINVNRPPINSPAWRPPAGGGAGGRPVRPPGGPVGAPARPVPLPANAIGRPNVQVPGSAVNRPATGRPPQGGPAQGGNAPRPGGAQPGGVAGQRPAVPAQGGTPPRPGGAQSGGVAGQRPTSPAQGGNAPRPGGAQPGGVGGQRPSGGGAGGANRPPAAAQRPSGALGGMNDGARAGQYGNRGAQSQAAQPKPGNAGGGGGQKPAAQQQRGGNTGGGARAGNRAG
jgi:Protein of unknown function (DUF3300)